MKIFLPQKPPVPEEEEEFKEGIQEDYVYKPPAWKPWVSLGSEKEIEEESVKESPAEVRASGHIIQSY